jgi:cell division protein FtsI/penicillin-binding protein 2
MKYLEKYKLFESLVDKKIQLLKDLSLELQDAGLQVEVTNGSNSVSRYTDDYHIKDKKFIIMRVTDDNERFDTDLYNTEIIDEFKETLKSYGMNPRGMSGGRNFCVFKFDKHGSMTNSPIIRESNSNKEMLDNIEDIFREIEDLGFKVESHKNIDGSDEGMESDDEAMRIWIEKFDVYGFSQEERECKYYPTDEFVSALLHLTSYVTESNLEYRIEIHDDSQVADVVSTESEIENMVNWINPIDYIKIIITYKD